MLHDSCVILAREIASKIMTYAFDETKYLGVLFLQPGDVRPIDPETKFCSHFEAVTIMRPGLMVFNSENHL